MTYLSSRKHNSGNPNYLNVKIVNKSSNILPEYAHVGDAGMDIRAWISKESYSGFDLTSHKDGKQEPCIILVPGQRKLVPTGIYVSIPIMFEIQVRPRSGNAIKHGLTVLNSPGTIDHQYRGEIKIILHNTGGSTHVVKNGDKIAQLVLTPVMHCVWKSVKDLSDTDRGKGGFGSTD